MAHAPGFEKPASYYLSCPCIRPEDVTALKPTDFIPVLHAEIDVASNKPNKQEVKTDYNPRDKVDKKHKYAKTSVERTG